MAGISNFIGYLKGYFGNHIQRYIEFVSIIAKYCIDFEQSFKKDKVDLLPHTITESDIKQSTWLYSQALMYTIVSSNFLKEKLCIDPSAVIHSQDGKEKFNCC